MLASRPDLIRLLLIPVFAGLAIRDIRTRRIDNNVWLPLYALGVLLIMYEAGSMFFANDPGLQPYLLRISLSILGLSLIAILAGVLGAFGGADVKAVIGIAILYPTFPVYFVKATAYPLHRSPLGIFSLTILGNALAVMFLYPVYLSISSMLNGDFSIYNLATKTVPVTGLESAVGVGFTSIGRGTTRFDIDVLRMYLEWRGVSLEEVCRNPWWFRALNPVPETVSETGDGEVVGVHTRNESAFQSHSPKPVPESVSEFISPDNREPDYWGAEAFIEDAEYDAYGMSPEQLRAELEAIVSSESVRVSPGLPFFLPLTIGLAVGVWFGDIVYFVLRLVSGT